MDPSLPEEPGKLFVGGISWDTNEAKLKDHFMQFGEVSDCVIMRDPNQADKTARKHRGFGFVTYKDVDAVPRVLQCAHVLDNKKIDPKQALIKSATPSAQAVSVSQGPTKKCFLGGLSAETSDDDVRLYFSQLNDGQLTVTDVDLKRDKQTSRLRGFGFVSFETEEMVDLALGTHFHQIKGKSVEIKKAEPRYATAGAQAMRQQQQMGGGGGTGGYTYQQSQPQYNQQPDYSRSTSAQQQYQQQQYYPGYNYANYAAGQYAATTAAAYSYDSSAAAGYPRTQTTSGDRQDTGSSYYQGSHTAQQMASYGQDGTSYGAARTYNGGHDVYGQQTAGYAQGGSQQQQQQQQRGYSRGGGGAYGH